MSKKTYHLISSIPVATIRRLGTSWSAEASHMKNALRLVEARTPGDTDASADADPSEKEDALA